MWNGIKALAPEITSGNAAVTTPAKAP